MRDSKAKDPQHPAWLGSCLMIVLTWTVMPAMPRPVVSSGQSSNDLYSFHFPYSYWIFLVSQDVQIMLHVHVNKVIATASKEFVLQKDGHQSRA